MKTVHCVRAVFQALAGVPGLTRADVSLGRADVDIVGEVEASQLAAAVELAGYRLRDISAAPRNLPLLGE